MPAPKKSPSEVLQTLFSDDPDSQLQAVRTIKNGIIGNRRKKTAYSSAVPHLVGLIRSFSTAQDGGQRDGAPQVDVIIKEDQSELVLHAVAALGSFAFGSSEGNSAVIAAGAFPLLKQLLCSGNQRIVASAARTIKILLEGNPPASHHIFHRGHNNYPSSNFGSTFQSGLGPTTDKNLQAAGRKCVAEDISTVNRLLQLISEGQEGIADVAASLLARACQTNEQQLVLSRAGAWEMIDILLAASPKGHEAGLDLAASMVQGNAEQASVMLGRRNTGLAKLMEFVRDRRPFTRLLACACIANAVACGSLPVEKKRREVSLVLHTVIKLLTSEPHKEIVEKGPSIVALLIRHNDGLQSAAVDAGVIPILISQVIHMCTAWHIRFTSTDAKSKTDDFEWQIHDEIFFQLNFCRLRRMERAHKGKLP